MWTDEYMGLCFNSACTGDISRGMEIKEGHIPAKLYRFRPCTWYALDELEKQYVRLVSPRRFNDLLDTRAKVDLRDRFYGNNPAIKDRYRKFMENHIPADAMDRMLGKENWFGEILDYVSREAERESGVDAALCRKALEHVLEKEIRELNESVGGIGQQVVRCCCFTEKKDNLAMWNHYAGQYAGICIEYDMTKFAPLDLQRRLMYPVVYTDRLPDIKEQFLDFQPKHANLFAWVTIHKKSDWSYEKEWRLVAAGIFHEDANMKFPAVSAVYLGNRIKREDRETVLRIAGKRKIGAYDLRVTEGEVAFSEA